jgi:sulfite exporter TauE/SafE
VYWIAFTLGFFGSLHCIGMCGPLAMAVITSKSQDKLSGLWSSLLYNTGRTIGYIALGVVFGLLGSVAALSGVQRLLSITVGIALLIIGLFALNPDQLISKVPLFKNIYDFVSKSLLTLLQKSRNVPSFYLGAFNGFLPCGLVYIAIAGAMTLSNVWGAMGFMLFFGLGTFPAMIGVSVGPNVVPHNIRVSLRKLYPIISLSMGIYLIYRGAMSVMPLELNFFDAINNPVMCH